MWKQQLASTKGYFNQIINRTNIKECGMTHQTILELILFSTTLPASEVHCTKVYQQCMADTNDIYKCCQWQCILVIATVVFGTGSTLCYATSTIIVTDYIVVDERLHK